MTYEEAKNLLPCILIHLREGKPIRNLKLGAFNYYFEVLGVHITFGAESLFVNEFYMHDLFSFTSVKEMHEMCRKLNTHLELLKLGRQHAIH